MLGELVVHATWVSLWETALCIEMWTILFFVYNLAHCFRNLFLNFLISSEVPKYCCPWLRVKYSSSVALFASAILPVRGGFVTSVQVQRSCCPDTKHQPFTSSKQLFISSVPSSCLHIHVRPCLLSEQGYWSLIWIYCGDHSTILWENILWSYCWNLFYFHTESLLL